MGELAIGNDPDSVLTALGLGSCIGICVYDPIARISGMAHVVLPKGTNPVETMPAKSMDIAIPNLLETMEKAGARAYRLKMVLAGGAKIFAGGSSRMDVGARNVEAAKEMLRSLRIKPLTSDLGGSSGRTLSIYTGTGIVTLRKAGSPESTLADLSASGSILSGARASI